MDPYRDDEVVWPPPHVVFDPEPHLPEQDTVKQPAHYQRGGLECVDVISAMTLDWNGPTAYRLGNTLKYLWRHLDKGDPKKDLQKAMEYLQMELDTYE